MTSINSLILDAGPLLTQTYSDLHSRAEHFFTTPSVYNEIRDERARQNLTLWGDSLVVRQPKPKSIQVVSEFAKRTGDYAVLSSTDMHIIALCYELECELNNGDWRLRKFPGQKKINGVVEGKIESGDGDVKENTNIIEPSKMDDIVTEESAESSIVDDVTSSVEVESEGLAVGDDDEWSIVKPKIRNSKKNKKRNNDTWSKPAKAEVPEVVPVASEAEASEAPLTPLNTTESTESNSQQVEDNVIEVIQDDNEDDDDWITSENLQETLEKGEGDKIEKTDIKYMKCAMSTGDFAMQNVALQMGLNLVNPTNGKHIKKVKNYMLRCHACFKLTGFPKDGKPKQFCPRCGGATLLRCSVQVSDNGKIQVFLKKNMQWSNRGDKYSLPTPQSRRARKLRHEDNPILLREDQKEYQKAVKDSMWKKRHNEKLLDEWIGTGSADSVATPFAISGYKRDATRHSGVRVGRGRYVNDSKKKK